MQLRCGPLIIDFDEIPEKSMYFVKISNLREIFIGVGE